LLKYLTPLSIGALLLGAGLGALLHAGDLRFDGLDWIEALIVLWIECLKIVALPLMLAYIVLALISRQGKDSGKAGGLAFLSHLALLAATGLTALVVTLTVLPYLGLDTEDLEAMSALSAGAAVAKSSWLDTVVRFIAANPISVVANDHIVAALLISVVLSLIVARAKTTIRDRLQAVMLAVSKIASRLVRWLLIFMPLVVFGFAFVFAAKVGLGIAHVVLVFLGLVCFILLLALGIVFLFARFAGGIPFSELVPGIAPILLMAFSTRSSLACMPLAIDTAKERFGLSESVVSVVIPLSVAAFKLNKIATSPARMLFLAFIYGISVSPVDVAVFMFVAGLTSFGRPGLPSASTFKMLPMYVAIGIPVEGYLLLHVFDSIPDLLNTALNATEDLTLAAVVDKLANG